MWLRCSRHGIWAPSKMLLILDRKFFAIPEGAAVGSDLAFSEIGPINPVDRCEDDLLARRRRAWLDQTR